MMKVRHMITEAIGQKLSQDGDPAEGLVVVQIVGQHHHDAPGGHADQKGELGDVESPGDIPAHAGDAQAEVQLLQVDAETRRRPAASRKASQP